jgi:RimJ/RimL family protein N-acetyltransferase
MLARLVVYLLETRDLEQLTTTCFGWNSRLERILEKNGLKRKNAAGAWSEYGEKGPIS